MLFGIFGTGLRHCQKNAALQTHKLGDVKGAVLRLDQPDHLVDQPHACCEPVAGCEATHEHDVEWRVKKAYPAVQVFVLCSRKLGENYLLELAKPNFLRVISSRTEALPQYLDMAVHFRN